DAVNATDAGGNAVVHHFIGQFTDEHYSNLSYTWDIWEEIDKQFDATKNIYVTVIDMSSESLDGGGVGGRGGHLGSSGGKALSIMTTYTAGIIFHELGHAFGLFHDYGTSNSKRISIFTTDPMLNSFCAAEWLNDHRAFNPERQRKQNERSQFIMHPPSLAAPPNAIQLRFEINDPNGIHQVQLLAPMPSYSGDRTLLGCKFLNGDISGTVEFVTNDLTPKTGWVNLRTIDVLGNLAWSQRFPIDITSVIPPPEALSIPDPHLAAAVQQQIGNAPTTHAILNLQRLDASNSGITDLTGLEHAHNLGNLNLPYNNITDISPLSELESLQGLYLPYNNITDIPVLSDLTNLLDLFLWENNITDISPLSELKNLLQLYISHNNITDISPLSELTHLQNLDLRANNITDISPLSELKNLWQLSISHNNITDISPLSELKSLRGLRLTTNNITDISPLSELKNLTYVDLAGNPLSNESIRIHIPAMQARGIDVTYNYITHPELLLIAGDKQNGLVGSTLSAPFVVEYRDANDEPKQGVSVTFSIREGEAELTDKTVTTDAEGRAKTFLHLGMKLGPITVRATAEEVITPLTLTAQVVLPENHVAADVNADGIVNVMDLVLVAATIGTTPPEDTYPNSDVNGDGVVNNDDLALVMAALETTSAAPAAAMTAETLQRWIDEAKQLTYLDETLLRGIATLEAFLASLLPEKTALLANFPNPFNPETWIPFHLAEPAEVTLHIYGVDGVLVRTLAFGQKSAGIYAHRTRAAYWDGRNAQGERVASGVYFYTLTAGDYTSTRKMLIRK
ncbi:MAG: leucine-rich repeat domain-containing protein, partial [Candidatus Poribacteria bacterium]|nr:leucine-rich repeat domain-containing protein [Candidatus Poribacteria bacterium]